MWSRICGLHSIWRRHSRIYPVCLVFFPFFIFFFFFFFFWIVRITIYPSSPIPKRLRSIKYHGLKFWCSTFLIQSKKWFPWPSYLKIPNLRVLIGLISRLTLFKLSRILTPMRHQALSFSQYSVDWIPRKTISFQSPPRIVRHSLTYAYSWCLCWRFSTNQMSGWVVSEPGNTKLQSLYVQQTLGWM
jgi:hypothetical protein